MEERWSRSVIWEAGLGKELQGEGVKKEVSTAQTSIYALFCLPITTGETELQSGLCIY